MNYVAIDFETTGLDPESDQIIEIGAARFSLENTNAEEFQTLVKPTVAISKGARRLHKLTAKKLADAPSIDDAWISFVEWLGDDTVLIAHNASFEAKFIRPLYKGTNLPPFTMIDTLALARTRIKGLSGYKLGDLVEIEGDAHRALPDACACGALFLSLSKTYKSGVVPLKTHGKTIMELAPQRSSVGQPNARQKSSRDSDKPTVRQLNYIERLGGNPRKPRTKAAASRYIDKLKGEDETSLIWRILWPIIQIILALMFVGVAFGWLS